MLKQAKIRNRRHLDFLKTLPCVACGSSPCDPAHIRIGSNSGMGQKPDDNKALSLCRSCHNLQHQRGERTFWGKHLEAAQSLCNALYIKSGCYGDCLILAARFKKVFNANI